MWLPCAHSWRMKAPVPGACDLASALSMTCGSSMLNSSKASNMVGRGCSDFRMTVFLSDVSMVVNHALYEPSVEAATFGSRTLRKFHLTSSLVNSRPECHVTPLRKLSLMLVQS